MQIDTNSQANSIRKLSKLASANPSWSYTKLQTTYNILRFRYRSKGFFPPTVHLQMYSQCIPRSQDLFTYSNLFHVRSHDTQFTRYSLCDLQSGLNISVFDCIWSSVHCQSICFQEMMDNSICDTLELHIEHNAMT